MTACPRAAFLLTEWFSLQLCTQAETQQSLAERSGLDSSMFNTPLWWDVVQRCLLQLIKASCLVCLVDGVLLLLNYCNDSTKSETCWLLEPQWKLHKQIAHLLWSDGRQKAGLRLFCTGFTSRRTTQSLLVINHKFRNKGKYRSDLTGKPEDPIHIESVSVVANGTGVGCNRGRILQDRMRFTGRELCPEQNKSLLFLRRCFWESWI